LDCQKQSNIQFQSRYDYVVNELKVLRELYERESERLQTSNKQIGELQSNVERLNTINSQLKEANDKLISNLRQHEHSLDVANKKILEHEELMKENEIEYTKHIEGL